MEAGPRSDPVSTRHKVRHTNSDLGGCVGVAGGDTRPATHHFWSIRATRCVPSCRAAVVYDHSHGRAADVPASKNCPPREPELYSCQQARHLGLLGGKSNSYPCPQRCCPASDTGYRTYVPELARYYASLWPRSTFCGDCTTSMGAVCPNCSGELVAPPRRHSANAYFPVDQ